MLLHVPTWTARPSLSHPSVLTGLLLPIPRSRTLAVLGPPVPRAEVWAAASRTWKQPCSTPKVSFAQETRVLEPEGPHMAPFKATLLLLSEHRMGGTYLWQLLEQSLLPSHTHPSQTPLNAIKQGRELPSGLSVLSTTLSPCPLCFIKRSPGLISLWGPDAEHVLQPGNREPGHCPRYQRQGLN